MRHHNQIITVIIFCALLSVLPFQSGNIPIISMQNDSRTPAAIDIFDIMPDPELDVAPDAFVNGTSGEFEYSYQPHDMQLNWTHTAGTALDFHSSDDETFPQFNDFVYFTQTFDWPYEDRPNDAEMYLNFSTSLSGNFSTEAEGGLMFRLGVWLIDSSGNWLNIFYSIPPYYTQIREMRINFNILDILNGWNGMIEDDYGVQEDPLDELSVGVGLVPTEEFLDYQGSQPWQTYSGSVGMSVSSLELYVIMDAEPNPATHLDPLYNKTYGTLFGDMISGYPTETSTPQCDRPYAMTSDPDGNLYITGETYISYELREELGIRSGHQTLLKYNPILGREYIVLNNNESRGRAITYNNGYLYTTGCNYKSEPEFRDLIVTKWTTGGQKLWETELEALHDQTGVAIGVHENESIYVVVSDFNYRGPEVLDDYTNLVLMKFDGEGSYLWNKTVQYDSSWDLSGELYIIGSRILLSYPGFIKCFDLDGNELWEETSSFATSDEDGNIYSVSPTGQEIEISQFTSAGNTTWSTRFGIEYAPGWDEMLQPRDITITPKNELLILVQGWRYDYSYHLIKYSLDGNHIQTWSIGDIAWPRQTYGPVMIEAAETGLLYCTFSQAHDIWTQCFVIGEYSIPSNLSNIDLGTIIIAGAGIGIVAIIGVIIYKKKGAT